MGGVRLAALAVAGSLGFTSVVCVPVALATPDAKPTPKSTPKSTSHTSAPAPTVTKTMTAKPPPPPCDKPQAFPASRVTTVPWAQQRLDFTSAWKITRGNGVTVAVVDSGINQSHPQLAGRVANSIDLTATHNTDCYGHGTQVAGIIAAKDERNGANPMPFVGVAPDVRLISIKVQAGETSTYGGTLLAKGIERAVQEGADIINVSAYNTDFPLLRQAVRDAQRHDVLIVAAAGNTDPQKRDNEQAAYPASYAGVLSVGALGPSGPLASFSNTSSKVDVSAPGDAIISTSGDGYVGDLQGTSYSAPYVTGIAALIKANRPGLTAQQIMNRIIATATASGDVGSGSGAGMVDPYAALTTLGVDNARPAVSRQAAAQPIDIGGPAPVDHRTRRLGGLIAGGAIGAALLVTFGGIVIPLGIRRRWRPGRVRLPPDDRD
jgi:membrane-anchored mycosin MYCP